MGVGPDCKGENPRVDQIHCVRRVRHEHHEPAGAGEDPSEKVQQCQGHRDRENPLQHVQLCVRDVIAVRDGHEQPDEKHEQQRQGAEEADCRGRQLLQLLQPPVAPRRNAGPKKHARVHALLHAVHEHEEGRVPEADQPQHHAHAQQGAYPRARDLSSGAVVRGADAAVDGIEEHEHDDEPRRPWKEPHAMLPVVEGDTAGHAGREEIHHRPHEEVPRHRRQAQPLDPVPHKEAQPLVVEAPRREKAGDEEEQIHEVGVVQLDERLPHEFDKAVPQATLAREGAVEADVLAEVHVDVNRRVCCE
mmetsp:Transcript_31175/g.94334  ORF Transcript_31175/g.94334 Transcript_31175/m.94334 type:complete len:304 (+) Transcript_31175:202-1113(+)